MKNRALDWLALTAILAVFASYICAIILTGPYAWDDGAITIAFGRTLIQTGVFALTMVSERVEGSSSLLYTLITGLPFLISDFKMPTSVFLAQFLTLLLLGILLFLVNIYLRPHLPKPLYRQVILLALAMQPMFLAEVLNAMEMIALANLFVLFCLAYDRQSLWIFPVILGLLLCRFETIFYLGVAFGAVFVLVPDARSYNLRLGLATFALFAFLTALRFAYFGDVFPNTIWAKMNPPYSSDLGLFASLRDKLRGGAEFFRVNFVLLIMVGVARVLGQGGSLTRDIKTWLVVGYGLFALVTGSNLGYEGRMFVGLLPVLLFAIVCLYSAAQQASSGTLFGLLLIALVGTFIQNAALVHANAWQVAKGAYFQAYLPDSLSQRLAPKYSDTHIGATPETYRRTGASVDKIRTFLGLETIRFSAPDVGGLGLCCDLRAIEIIDSALLTNQRLAHDGYSGFEDQLIERRPDLIAIHAWWADEPKIYQMATFQADYRPVVFENTLFWVHRDRLSQLEGLPQLQFTALTKEFDLETLRNDLRAKDFAYLESMREDGQVLMSMVEL